VTYDSRISGLCEYEPSPVYADSQRVEYLEGQRVCRKRAPFIVATEKNKVAGILRKWLKNETPVAVELISNGPD
jgi:hypothetical protein